MDRDRIAEMFAAFGTVDVRRMFGGIGIYADGIMFALGHDGSVYLKADELTRAAFEREGQGPFTYDTRSGRHALTSYWRMPDRLHDDPDELARWAAAALAAARRAQAGKPGKRRR
jgi:DNA transformation protein and related proteins